MMIVSCPVCKKKYRMDDKKIKDRSTAVRCAGCGQVFKVSPAAGAKSPPDSAFLRLTCPECGSEMNILAVIMDTYEIKKILKHPVKTNKGLPGVDKKDLLDE